MTDDGFLPNIYKMVHMEAAAELIFTITEISAPLEEPWLMTALSSALRNPLIFVSKYLCSYVPCRPLCLVRYRLIAHNFGIG